MTKHEDLTKIFVLWISFLAAAIFLQVDSHVYERGVSLDKSPVVK